MGIKEKNIKLKFCFKQTIKDIDMHKGHYFIYNIHIQKKIRNYSSESACRYYKNLNGSFVILETGISKEKYLAHDYNHYDYYKDMD